MFQKVKPSLDFEKPLTMSDDFPLHWELFDIPGVLGLGEEEFREEQGSCCQVLTAVKENRAKEA